jgi:hypothetical protein
MEQLDRSSSLGTRLKLHVTDVAEVSALPSGVRRRWGAWEAVVAGKSKAERAQALREANYYGTGDVEDVEVRGNSALARRSRPQGFLLAPNALSGLSVQSGRLLTACHLGAVHRCLPWCLPC